MSEIQSFDDATVLRRRHRELDTTVKKMCKHHGSDQEEIKQLKLEKLRLKEQIEGVAA